MIDLFYLFKLWFIVIQMQFLQNLTLSLFECKIYNNIMKKENRKHLVPTDQTYVQNINLVTGDKFNYDRPMLTQRQIKQLCIDETKSYLDKFMQIILEGEKIQKWSAFQNLPYYIRSSKDAQLIFDTIYKNYSQMNQYLPIMADGIYSFLQNPIKDLTNQTISIIYELAFRTLSQNPTLVQDWGKVYAKIVKYPCISYDKSIDFVNGSFSMNSPPQRRRVAFCMINHLMEYSKDIRKAAHSKVLFFNQDQNSKTRYQICCILRKLIEEDSNQEQIWKAIWEYFHDKDPSVRELSNKILCKIYHPSNFQTLSQSLSQQINEMDFCKNMSDFIICYRCQIQKQQRPKTQIISFFNRVFKSKKIQNICNLLSNITVGVIQILGQNKIYQDLNFSLLPLKNKEVLEHLFLLYHEIQDLEFRDTLKNLIFKTMKQIQYQVYGNSRQLGEMFDLVQEDEVSIYLSVCTKMLQASKWHQLAHILQVFPKMILCQNLYQKACFLILKLWMSCPVFLLDKTIQCVIYLVLISKKSLQFLITIRQKILNSKFWSHRKNYIMFYAAMKYQTSFDIHKLIPTLMYKNIVADKSVGVKMTFLEYAPRIYKYTQPVTAQKSMLKQAVLKLGDDKDPYVKEKAQITQIQISKIDKDPKWLAQIYDRSREISEKQTALTQVLAESKRTIKTENQISKSTAKSKRRVTNQHRKTINVGKAPMYKDISIDSITAGTQKPSTNLIPKKNNLFRCHSVKIKTPAKKT